MKKSFLCILLLALVFRGFAQEQPKVEQPAEQAGKKPIEELRLKLNEDGSHYIKATFLNQTWFRYADYNPGTTVLTTPTS
ncbi:MAG TPA: hypothetical protein VKQ08_08010, partial [Cyclobacteriaceae bacterium]|nr:hypothetical protein [Cyclobacteriaceae bacterium]